MPKLHLGFLASHNGSNMQAIIDSIKEGKLDAKPCCIISNNSASGALERARNEGIPHYHISSLTHPGEGFADKEIINKFKLHGVEIVILAGYMKKIPAELIRAFNGKILNIHPALLPKHGGKGLYGKFVHESVLAAGDMTSGPTVHLVDEHYDHGKILAQTEVPVMPDDTPESLAERVLVAEHKIYPETLQRIAIGDIRI